MDAPVRPRFDPDTSRGTAPSPCRSICALDQNAGICTGCGRTMAEIMIWPRATEEQKRAIWRRLNALGNP